MLAAFTGGNESDNVDVSACVTFWAVEILN